MFEWLVDPEAWISLLTLTALEIVLGIDNIIFISILVGRLPANQRQSGRIIGLGLAMITRILLLVSLSWMMKLTDHYSLWLARKFQAVIDFIPWGLFLIVKEVQAKVKKQCILKHIMKKKRIRRKSVTRVLIQIAIFGCVFSLDSVITAVGMANHLQ